MLLLHKPFNYLYEIITKTAPRSSAARSSWGMDLNCRLCVSAIGAGPAPKIARFAMPVVAQQLKSKFIATLKDVIPNTVLLITHIRKFCGSAFQHFWSAPTLSLAFKFLRLHTKRACNCYLPHGNAIRWREICP